MIDATNDIELVPVVSLEPTSRLRWLERDGETVLQQAWAVMRGPYRTGELEWRDVRTVVEGADS